MSDMVTVSREELLCARAILRDACLEAAERGDEEEAKRLFSMCTDLFEILTKDHDEPAKVWACLERSRELCR